MVRRHSPGRGSRAHRPRRLHANHARSPHQKGFSTTPCARRAQRFRAVSGSDLLDVDYSGLRRTRRMVGQMAGRARISGSHKLVLHTALSRRFDVPRRSGCQAARALRPLAADGENGSRCPARSGIPAQPEKRGRLAHRMHGILFERQGGRLYRRVRTRIRSDGYHRSPHCDQWRHKLVRSLVPGLAAAFRRHSDSAAHRPRHNGWVLKAPAGARLEWPVRPYNPYSNAPELGIERAAGVWTLPLEPKSQVLSFSLEAK